MTPSDEELRDMRLKLCAFHKALGDFIYILLAAGAGHLIRDLWEEHLERTRRD